MPTFDFAGASNASFPATFLSSFSSITAIVFTPSNGVNFTFTLSAQNLSSTSVSASAAIFDNTAPGISGSVLFSTTISYSVSLLISFSTTPSRTAFTASPVVNGTFASGPITAPGVNANQLQFSVSGLGTSVPFKISSIVAALCFAKGTRIATPTGAVRVEDLAEGDTVLTADRRETTVRWLGLSPVDTRLSHPAKVNPVRITSGALGNGLPERDLRLSPDHAIEIDGMLINAGALVNGSTIYQEPGKMPDGFTYYHVETDAHELLLAEGVAAETFIDYAGRETFENGGESTAHIPEMDLPRISSARLVPDHIRARLAPAAVAA